MHDERFAEETPEREGVGGDVGAFDVGAEGGVGCVEGLESYGLWGEGDEVDGVGAISAGG